MNEQSKETAAPCGDTVFVRRGDAIMIFSEDNAFFHTIKDPAGLHARPAGALVRLAKQYKCAITVSAGERSAGADNVIRVMSLGAKQGTRLKLAAHGEDAPEALAALRAFLRENL